MVTCSPVGTTGAFTASTSSMHLGTQLIVDSLKTRWVGARQVIQDHDYSSVATLLSSLARESDLRRDAPGLVQCFKAGPRLSIGARVADQIREAGRTAGRVSPHRVLTREHPEP